jgi:nucleoid-associated protein YgaU
MVTNVVAGVASVLADTLAPSLGTLAGQATSAVLTPDELKTKALDLAVNDVVAPFLHAGSETLGDAAAGALAQRTGLTQKPSAPPSGKAVVQVQVALKEKLTAELAWMPNLRVVADHARLTPDQLAAELAGAIAQRLAGDLAHGLVRLPSSRLLDDPSVIAIAEQVTKQQLPQRPPPTVAYTVRPGDSLWDISRQLLGPGATAHEIGQIWQVIYRDNRTTIGTNPNHLVPGQVLRIPSTGESALSQGWVLLPWLVVAPGTLTGMAIRRRRRSDRAKERRPAAQAEVKAP